MKAKKATKEKQDTRGVKRWLPPHGYFAVVAFLIVAAAAVVLVNLQYANRALPGVYVGSAAVNGMSPPEVKKIVEQQKKQLKVTFQDGEKNVEVSAEELGMMVDVDATVERTLLTRRSTNVADNLALWKTQTVSLVYQNDAGMLKDYIARHFPQLYIDPQDAQLIFNESTKQFDVKPGVPGKGFDIKRFESALPDLARNPRMLVLPLSTVPVEPLIGDAAVAQTQKDI